MWLWMCVQHQHIVCAINHRQRPLTLMHAGTHSQIFPAFPPVLAAVVESNDGAGSAAPNITLSVLGDSVVVPLYRLEPTVAGSTGSAVNAEDTHARRDAEASWAVTDASHSADWLGLLSEANEAGWPFGPSGGLTPAAAAVGSDASAAVTAAAAAAAAAGSVGLPQTASVSTVAGSDDQQFVVRALTAVSIPVGHIAPLAGCGAWRIVSSGV
jgi:hypothetical protein